MNDGVSGDELRFNLDLPVVQTLAEAAVRLTSAMRQAYVA